MTGINLKLSYLPINKKKKYQDFFIAMNSMHFFLFSNIYLTNFCTFSFLFYFSVIVNSFKFLNYSAFTSRTFILIGMKGIKKDNFSATCQYIANAFAFSLFICLEETSLSSVKCSVEKV